MLDGTPGERVENLLRDASPYIRECLAEGGRSIVAWLASFQQYSNK